MDSVTEKTLPAVSTATDDGMPNNSTDNGISLKNSEMTTIPGVTIEKTMSTENSEKGKSASAPNNDDDDDVDDLMDIQIPSSMITVDDGESSEILLERKRPTGTAPQKPDKDIQVDDGAILDCWNLTVASHDANPTFSPDTAGDMPVPPSTSKDNGYQWQAKDLVTPNAIHKSENSDILGNWQPQPLSLPPWAVDPFLFRKETLD
eukprot:CAMPEP_0116151404 /NCGR_PEP_ID=MMETSP0329-20121206/20077_1 /TAXON_ID=697910 /ORGANISM="Pseudo-nitzschia arenysensis, Strain B593" /LENGTH=204 /DNA_ID=CAMNT_0003648011 /DNA_START=83 /DNA_END=697 /DNA_ORIENTATION=-